MAPARANLEGLLGRMRGRRIAVLGDVMLDRYLMGDIERTSPEAPVPVVAIRERRATLGGAANVAANIAALGATASLVGVTGQDAAGDTLAERLAAAGISSDGLVRHPTRPTTVKTRVMARGQQVVRIDEEECGPLDAATRAGVCRLAFERIIVADGLVLEDYNKGVLCPEVIGAALSTAQRRGIPIVVDPKDEGFFGYAGATVFKPNRRELAAALGAGASLDDPATLRAAVQRLGVEWLLVTLGGSGMVLQAQSGEPTLIPGTARDVFDVSGAGDTVTAWVAAALAAGATVPEAAALANVAAGVEVGKAGVATVLPLEVLAALRGSGG